MTTPADADDPGSALVPVADLSAVARCTDVVGTVRMVDGELVVRVEPSRVREVTVRRLAGEPDPQPTTLAALPFMRYVGPLTPDEAARLRAEVARWEARPWWRRWCADVADWCWGDWFWGWRR